MMEPVSSDLDPEIVAQAWQLAIAEGGGTAALLVIAVAVLWRWASGLMARLQAQHEALLTRLIDEQSKAIGKVEQAVTRLDSSFTTALARLDRHETKLEDHAGRIVRLESAGESGIRRRRAAAGE